MAAASSPSTQVERPPPLVLRDNTRGSSYILDRKRIKKFHRSFLPYYFGATGPNPHKINRIRFVSYKLPKRFSIIDLRKLIQEWDRQAYDIIYIYTGSGSMRPEVCHDILDRLGCYFTFHYVGGCGNILGWRNTIFKFRFYSQSTTIGIHCYLDAGSYRISLDVIRPDFKCDTLDKEARKLEKLTKLFDVNTNELRIIHCGGFSHFPKKEIMERAGGWSGFPYLVTLDSTPLEPAFFKAGADLEVKAVRPAPDLANQQFPGYARDPNESRPYFFELRVEDNN